MTAPALLIVTGHPATGKTTLATHLSRELTLPLISKDGFKETLFDTLGWSDRVWTRQIGVAAIALLYQTAGALLAAAQPLIVESNFRADLDTARMRELAAAVPFRPIQIRCIASGEVMAERYLRRITEGRRHPGHCESTAAEDVALMRSLGHIGPLEIGGDLLTVDTGAGADAAAVVGWARARLGV